MTEPRTDADAMWDSLDRQMEQIPLDLEQERDDFYSQPDWEVYRLHYTDMDGYRLFSWLSVPASANGPVPALLRMPDYGSVHDIIYTPLRSDALVMNPTHRGQRHSDTQFQAEYPGLLTEGIDRLQTFVMMRVFADALRAMDVLLAQKLANVGTVALTGQGLGGTLSLLAAARRPGITAVAADTPLALGHPEVLEQELAYPLDELNDYLRVYPHRRDAVLANTAPLDPVSTAPKVQVPVLVWGAVTGGCAPCPSENSWRLDFPIATYEFMTVLVREAGIPTASSGQRGSGRDWGWTEPPKVGCLIYWKSGVWGRVERTRFSQHS